MSVSALRAAAAALCLFLAAPVTWANTITLDFERGPGADRIVGTADDVTMPALGRIHDEYAPWGVVFTEATVMQSSFFNGDPLNHFLSSTVPAGQFTVPVYGISIESQSFWPATLSAFGADGQLLATATIPHLGGGPELHVLSLLSDSPISSFRIEADNPNHILNLDNMVLVTSVPEPGQPLMLATGLALLGWRLRRSRRR